MPDTIFQIASTLALGGWAVLLAGPFLPRLSQVVAGGLIPALLATVYAGIVLAFWAGADGGFASLGDVARLFESRWLLLAGWIHYLAFDLVVGAWVARVAQREGVAFWLVVPCLVLTFLFGPAGWLAFQAIRLARSASVSAA